MTPAYAVLVLLLMLLVAVPAAALVMRLAGTRALGRRRESSAVPLDAVGPLVELDMAGLATSSEILAFTPRERAFVSRAARGRLGGTLSATLPAAAPALPADREVPLASFVLVCPACGSSLGTPADVAHFVGSCPSCCRRVASRRRASRISHAIGDRGEPR